MIKNRSLGHLKISSGNMDEVLKFIEKRIAESKQTYCIPLNLTKYSIAKKDLKLREVINSADLIISDGIPIVWKIRWEMGALWYKPFGNKVVKDIHIHWGE